MVDKDQVFNAGLRARGVSIGGFKGSFNIEIVKNVWLLVVVKYDNCLPVSHHFHSTLDTKASIQLL